MRKPIGLTSIGSRGDGVDTVICDDGSVWFRGWSQYSEWKELPPIPGTQRAIDKLNVDD